MDGKGPKATKIMPARAVMPLHVDFADGHHASAAHGNGSGGNGATPQQRRASAADSAAPHRRRPPARDRWTSALESLLQPGMSGTVRLTADQTLDVAELHEWLLRQPDPELDGEDGPAVDIASPQKTSDAHVHVPSSAFSEFPAGEEGLFSEMTVVAPEEPEPEPEPSASRRGSTESSMERMREWHSSELSLTPSMAAPPVLAPLPPPPKDPGTRRSKLFAYHSFPRRSTLPDYRSVPRTLLDGAEMGDETAAYLASEYGGVRVGRTDELIKIFKNATRAQIFIAGMQMSKQLQTSSNDLTASMNNSMTNANCDLREDEPSAGGDKFNKMYVPPEWNRLDASAKGKLRAMLSLETLGKWDGFDIFAVAEECGGSPLLFVGWALLASPYAQAVMDTDPDVAGDGASDDASDTSETSETNAALKKKGEEDGGGYDFTDHLALSPRVLCNFLRSIEADYSRTIPYHTNTHAADVLQTAHCLLGMGGDAYVSSPLESFTLLLGAVIHDVGHPGRNNAYQVRLRADPAITYNDRNVLENMHLSLAFGRLLGDGRDEHLDILSGLDREQVDQVRRDAVASVLNTDFSRHFEVRSELGAQVEARATKGGDGGGGGGGVDPDVWRDADGGQPAKQVLRYLLHMADISSQAKPIRLAEEWSGRVYDEFFAQGDDEERLGLPISPLCDRRTTREAQSQVGFLQYIVKPALELLGKLVPRVAEEVMPILEENLVFWQRKSEEEKEGEGMEGEQESEQKGE